MKAIIKSIRDGALRTSEYHSVIVSFTESCNGEGLSSLLWKGIIAGGVKIYEATFELHRIFRTMDLDISEISTNGIYDPQKGFERAQKIFPIGEEIDDDRFNLFEIPISELSDGLYDAVKFDGGRMMKAYRRAGFFDRATALAICKKAYAANIANGTFEPVEGLTKDKSNFFMVNTSVSTRLSQEGQKSEKISILNGRPALKAVIDQVAEVTGYLWQKGWAERNGGNITVNVTEYMDEACRQMAPIAPVVQIGMVLPQLKGKYFYCKGTGKRMRDLAKAPMQNGSIVRICDDCASYEIIADEPVVPTSELPTHLALQNLLLETGSTYKATLHTHPIELVAMSHIKRFLKGDEMTRVLWSMIPETLAFAPLGIGIVPYALPGSVSLAEATVEQIRTHDVVLWEKHGTVAVGTDIMDAFDQTDVLCKAANIYMCARNMGSEPDGMTAEAMKEVQDVFNLPKKRPC